MEASEFIYKAGDQSNFAYLLTKCEVEVISDKIKRVGFIYEDEMFGELAILLNTRRTANAIALKKSNELLIPKKNLLDDSNKSSFFIKAILRSKYMRLTNLNSTNKIDFKSLSKRAQPLK